MFSTVFAVFVISLIGSGLAAVLTVSERYIADYGECDITVNKEKKFTVNGGATLLETLVGEKIFIPSACGGKGTCGLCKVKVLEGAGPLMPTEEPFLDAQQKEEGIRLSCMVKVRNDIAIEIPPELLFVKEFTCRCTKILDLTHDIKQFRFELIDPPTIEYVPGQFIQLLTPPYKESKDEVFRAYSISSDPAEKDAVEIIMRLVPGGKCTTYYFEHFEEGKKVRFNGPYGEFQLTDTDAPMIFIAGGSGMAPIKCILHHMQNTQNKRKAVYFFGARTVNDLFLLDEMKRFEENLHDFKFVPVVGSQEEDDGWEGERGLVTEALERHFDNAEGHEGYLCGSPGMLNASIEILKKLGITDEKIYYDKFE